MHFSRLRTAADDLYVEAMELYKESFPPHELRQPSSQAEIMENVEYHFNLIYDEDEMVGILLCWETERFIYVEHFCIYSKMRNKRYGQKTLNLLNQRKKTVILEIDPPVDDISIHRKGFYERAGYVANHFLHKHPPYQAHHSGHNLVVMSFPQPLSAATYENFNHYLNHVVMHF